MTEPKPTPWPADEIVRRPVAKLVPYARNARTHSKEQVRQIAASIREWGWTNPVLIDEDDGVIAGHGRLLAAEMLGVVMVPCVVARGWTKQQRQAYVLADNQLALSAGWDRDMLRLEIGELQADGFDLELIGFDPIDLKSLTSGGGGEVVQDEVPEPTEDVVTKPGETWTLGDHLVICGDGTDLATWRKLIGDRLVDAIVTSPPYNQKIDTFRPSGMHKEGGWVKKVGSKAYADDLPESEYQQQQRAALDVWHQIIRDRGSLFYNHKNRYRDKRVVTPWEWLPGPFKVRQEIIWKRAGSVTQNARMFLPSDERIWWLYRGDDFTFDDSTEIKTWSTVWDIANETNKEHPVAFPVKLPARCIRACTGEGMVVADPYLGSGTTIIAAEQLGRRCVGTEINPAFVDVIVRRWQKLTGRRAVGDGGREFPVAESGGS